VSKEIREQINLVKTLNESLKNLNDDKSYGFFKTTSSIPDYEKVLAGKNSELPNKYESWKGEVQWMTKEEYLRECARIQNTSYSDQFRYVIEKKTRVILDAMKSGVKFDMPYLNYVENSQEGRHRVVAADMLGQKHIPILILHDDEDDISKNLPDMIGKWDDLVIKNGVYYVKFNIDGWKSEDRLLSCIAPSYDFYYLDVLFKIIKNNMDIEDFLSKSIKNGDLLDSNFSYITKNKIYYDGESNEQFSENFLLYCFMLKILTRNFQVIYDCVIYEKDTLYLKIVPQDINTDFDYYENCQDMMLDSSKNKNYIKEYDIISTDEESNLYTINSEDINKMKKIFDSLSMKYS
jgi:hypothetical protein